MTWITAIPPWTVILILIVAGVVAMMIIKWQRPAPTPDHARNVFSFRVACVVFSILALLALVIGILGKRIEFLVMAIGWIGLIVYARRELTANP